MDFEIDVRLRYSAKAPTDLLLHIEAANGCDQKVLQDTLKLNTIRAAEGFPAEEGIGQRHWLHFESAFECDYNAVVQINRSEHALGKLQQTPLSEIPADVVKYLMASRYCHLYKFDPFLSEHFSGISGGKLVASLSDWIQNNLEYTNNASGSSTSAHQSFELRKGVCRDYAHVLITMCRAAAIPARFVSAYAPRVSPMDFHAVVEVYLEDAWHLVDPTGMSSPQDIIRIGVGRDATDVAFMTSYNWLDLQEQSVKVSQL